MPSPSEAEEHLRVIRSLMERATYYRAISVQGAVVGGALSMVTGLGLYGIAKAARLTGQDDDGLHSLFLIAWIGILLLTGLANFYFLWRSARMRHERFLSPGMRQAGVSLAPALWCGGMFTGASIWLGWNVAVLPPIWMMFYGLALIGTAHFSPRSILYLGAAFLAAACVTGILVLGEWGVAATSHPALAASLASLLMAGSFGLFHVIYAIFVWPPSVARDEEAIPGDV